MIAGQDFSVSIFQCADGIKLICHRTIILPGVMDTLWPTTTAGTADFPWRFVPLSIIAKAYMGGITGTIHKNHRVVQTVGKHIIAKNTLSGAGVGIGIDESAQFGIVITGLEVVERGLSVLGLTTILDYTLLIPTRNRTDFVWVFRFLVSCLTSK